ncbi:MAG: DUF1493 family protein [Limnohabitans sp.]|nr:DUF1493 family protein [Limnohabitans sp.]
MRITEKEIIAFIKDEFWETDLNSYSDVFCEVGIDGDDCYDFLMRYSDFFCVDIKSFLWYFHYQAEGNLCSFSNFFSQVPNESVTYIPITVKMLSDFANSKKWNINYPVHELPSKK